MFRLQDYMKRSEDLKSSALIVPKEEEIRQIQLILFEMFKDMRNFFERHDLQYVLVGGSALGAIRHQGFIPWDDDIDIDMPRDSYDRFVQLFDNDIELQEKYLMAAPDSSRRPNEFNIRIISKRTKRQGIFNQNLLYHQGLCIDSCAIDYVPDNKFLYYVKGIVSNILFFLINSKMIYICRTKLSDEMFSSSLVSKFFYSFRLFLGLCLSPISYKRLCGLFDGYIASSKPSKKVSTPSGRKHYFGETWPSSLFFPFKKAKFETETVYIPNDIDGYLRGMYGDNYMELPPEEKRERHACVLLDLDFKQHNDE